MKEALLYEPVAGGKVVCTACARYCKIGEGQIGLCGVRQNLGGKLQLLVYGKVIAGHVDPIEKKPVTHYMPGSKIFSIATTGCNWLCHPAGAQILMSDGEKRNVEDLVPGDSVWSYDVENGMDIHPSVVTHTGSRIAQLWELRTGTRSKGRILLTEEHPVLTQSGWKPVKKLRQGEHVLKAWYQNTKAWKRNRSRAIQKAIFHCKNCGETAKGLQDWNRHRGECYTRGLTMAPDVRRRLSKRMKANNPMKDPEVARRALETSKRRYLRDPTHGWHRNVERLRQYLHRHPSEGQKRLYGLLDELGIEYEKEFRIYPDKRLPESRGYYIADAAIPDQAIDIEVDGWWHFNNDDVIQGDKVRDRTLRRNGWDVLRIAGSYVFSHPEEVKTLIVERLGRPMMQNKKAWVVVDQVQPTRRFEEVFSIEAIPHHNYVADGVIVHNCSYCQNADISQRRKVEGTDISPQGVVDLTIDQGAQGIAYTYNQPTIFMEFAHDIGVLARQAGLINIFVSNGYDTPETIAMMPDFLDAITVDFKGNGEPKFVRRYIGIPDPQPIFDSLIEMRDKTDVHIEITDLVVPDVGDDLEYARKLSQFVYDELGPDIPIQFLRFHPDYKMMDLPLTPIETLEKHHRVAKEVGLNYVYIGNVPGHPLEHTYCPGCGRIAIRRHGFDIQGWGLDDQNRCQECGYQLPIVGALQDTWQKIRFRPVM
jgi:pyruvate formate lyase activating enzyme